MPGEVAYKDWVRLMQGYLDQRTSKKGKLKRRWIVFQGSSDGAHYQLTSYKKKDERVTSDTYTISKNTFIGSVKGHIHNKADIKTIYWALILKSSTPIFQETLQSSYDGDDRVSLAQWHELIKSRFETESWQVKPVSGVSPKVKAEPTLTLIFNKHRFGLVTQTPPECCEQWAWSTVTDCQASNESLFIYIDAPRAHQTGLGALAFREVQLRMMSIADAQRARDVLNKLRKKPDIFSSSPGLELPTLDDGRYSPSPSPRASPIPERKNQQPPRPVFPNSNSSHGAREPAPPPPPPRTPESLDTRTVFQRRNPPPTAFPISRTSIDTRAPAPPPPPPRSPESLGLGTDSPEYTLPGDRFPYL